MSSMNSGLPRSPGSAGAFPAGPGFGAVVDADVLGAAEGALGMSCKAEANSFSARSIPAAGEEERNGMGAGF